MIQPPANCDSTQFSNVLAGFRPGSRAIPTWVLRGIGPNRFASSWRRKIAMCCILSIRCRAALQLEQLRRWSGRKR